MTSSSTSPPSNSFRKLFAPLTQPNSILTDLAPRILNPTLLNSIPFSSTAVTSSGYSISQIGVGSNQLRGKLGIGFGAGGRDSIGIYILEKVDELLRLEIPETSFDLNNLESNGIVPLLRGFEATTAIASTARIERRKKRAIPGQKCIEFGKDGLKRNGKGKGKARRHDVGDRSEMTLEELISEESQVVGDMANLNIKRAVVNSQIIDVELKIAALDIIRHEMRDSLLTLREEELELEDELQGIRESKGIQEERTKGRNVNTSSSSRRRKGPAFLPSEHDDLPNGVAFMTLHGHLAPITSLDFSEPYGVAVTASLDESVRMWDLTTGEEMGFLRGHDGAVKALQVESNLCITGGADGGLRIWDLDLAEQQFSRAPPLFSPSNTDSVNKTFEDVLLGKVEPVDVFESSLLSGGKEDGLLREDISRTVETPCVKNLDGHTKAVTSLYFDGNCLVTGSSDRTLRQWDLTTGQCVLTMDILWAISNPLTSQTLSSNDNLDLYADPYISPESSPARPSSSRRSNSAYLPGGSGGFGMSPGLEFGDGNSTEDFVGGVQFWGYALASGTGDGCVRMWDMRTGQAHRTLVGHTGPVTCVQFDETHLVSGSLDKSIRIWDLRTGGISETIRFDQGITALQFDSRKIVAAAGENGVRIYNRTTLQHSSLSINGHTSPVTKLRFMDRYLVTGSEDCTVKVWSM